MDKKELKKVIKILKNEYKNWDAPAKRLSKGYEYKRTPYTILISTLLSFRTKDEVTVKAANRLFKVADNPKDMIKLSKEKIAKLIYPVGFYNQKAKSILDVTKILIEKYNSKVPDSLKELTSIKGVGPKTAKIVLENAYNKPYIAVDTHVHRLLNLWKIVETKTPQETDKLIEDIFEDSEKIGLNKVLVSFGQTICKPQKPKCEICPIRNYCK
ncbi:endonuclease III domain-containing protein [Nitrosophilus kaiyonis]|uniref:endonuclease III domain-containing protein n=1 Tax=Nitrosophilus kaiyonis TaxID=2930200 RepID=UPI002492D2FF|nr:endonuclease III [Nitrosophilus kaiyonis]